MRTSQRTVTFSRPFVLEGLAEKLPAGDCCAEIEDDFVEGTSCAVQAAGIDGQHSDAALERQRRSAGPLPDPAPLEKHAP